MEITADPDDPERLVVKNDSVLRRVGRDPTVVREIAATVTGTVLFVLLAAFVLSRLNGPPGPAEEVSAPEAAAAGSTQTEIPLVTYRGPIGVPGVGEEADPVRVAEVDLVGVVRADEERWFQLRDHVRRHEARLTADVDAVVRSATADELADPAFAAVRDRVFARMTATLGPGILEQVVFAHYRVFDTPALSR